MSSTFLSWFHSYLKSNKLNINANYSLFWNNHSFNIIISLHHKNIKLLKTMFLIRLSTSLKLEDQFTVIYRPLSKSSSKLVTIGTWKETLSENFSFLPSYSKSYPLNRLSNNGHQLLKISLFNAEIWAFPMHSIVLKFSLKNFMKKIIKIMKNGLFSGLTPIKINF